MQPTDKKLKELRSLLDDAEQKISAVKRILFEQIYLEQAKDSVVTDVIGANTFIEGVFDGEEMIDAMGKKYPVPANYSSKSKLVAGDKLKLTITPDGSFIFKQIGPVDRKRCIGTLLENNGKWHVVVSGKKFNVLQASVTYYRAKPNDQITAILPKNGETNWAAIENCLARTAKDSK